MYSRMYLYLSSRFGGTSLRRMYFSTSNINLLRLVISDCTQPIAAVKTYFRIELRNNM